MAQKETEKNGIADFEEKLGYVFSDPDILNEALTHASCANESGLSGCNERLEFLGDAVLELCVSEILYREYPVYDEGALTKERSNIVREKSLAEWAERVSLPPLLKLSKGLEIQKGRRNPSILADAMEAVLGGIFMDGGYRAAYKTVKKLINTAGCDKSPPYGEKKDPKSSLQELMQSSGGKPPIYRLKRRSGPDHASTFEVEVVTDSGRVISSGVGNSIKAAEFAAADRAIESLSSCTRG